ncbi:hypothetical protein ECANGB1_1203 [Enterospora canceri]|uniref:Uncharacterized protein n=1 Tax=Enterospora canceri TaxID=1081671 RepID=A0A1Y1S6K0_9MICR|nr:hypothetical protein ECANGB1_1203 [Enterospora canceri]
MLLIMLNYAFTAKSLEECQDESQVAESTRRRQLPDSIPEETEIQVQVEDCRQRLIQLHEEVKHSNEPGPSVRIKKGIRLNRFIHDGGNQTYLKINKGRRSILESTDEDQSKRQVQFADRSDPNPNMFVVEKVVRLESIEVDSCLNISTARLTHLKLENLKYKCKSNRKHEFIFTTKLISGNNEKVEVTLSYHQNEILHIATKSAILQRNNTRFKLTVIGDFADGNTLTIEVVDNKTIKRGSVLTYSFSDDKFHADTIVHDLRS